MDEGKLFEADARCRSVNLTTNPVAIEKPEEKDMPSEFDEQLDRFFLSDSESDKSLALNEMANISFRNMPYAERETLKLLIREYGSLFVFFSVILGNIAKDGDEYAYDLIKDVTSIFKRNLLREKS
jgi:hypothetical protein